MKFLKTMGLDQLIHNPTQVTLNSATVIDHIITNRVELYTKGSVLPLGISDHNLIFTNCKRAKIPHSFTHIPCRSYTKLVDIDFQHDMELVDWSPVLNCEDVDEAVELFQVMFMRVVDKTCPFCKPEIVRSCTSLDDRRYAGPH